MSRKVKRTVSSGGGLASLAVALAAMPAVGAPAELRRFECPPVLQDAWAAEERARQCQLLPERDRSKSCEAAVEAPPTKTKLTHVEIVDFDGLNLFSTKPRVIYCGYEFVEKGFQTEAHCRFETSWKYEQIARKAIRTGVVATVYFCQVDPEVGRTCHLLCNHRPQ